MPVEQILQEISQTAGVRGVFFVTKGGDLQASATSSAFSREDLEALSTSLSRSLEALDASRQHVQELDLTFQNGRLIVRNLPSGRLALVCQANLNLPFLNLNLAPLIRRLSGEMKPSGASLKPEAFPDRAAIPMSQEHPLLIRLTEEGQSILQATREAGLLARLVGTVAVALHCSDGKQWLLPPTRATLEMVGRASDADALAEVIRRLGFDPLRPFNQEHRRERLIFRKRTPELCVDIQLDAYEGFHRLEVLGSLRAEEEFLAPADLLLLCLQRAESSEADLREIVALVWDHELSAGPASEAIDVSRVSSVCAEDWGWYRTATKNLDRLIFTGSWGGLPESPVLMERLKRLREEIEKSPKGTRWQMRAAIGDAVRWYRIPSSIEELSPPENSPT